jgi:sulfotransferase
MHAECSAPSYSGGVENRSSSYYGVAVEAGRRHANRAPMARAALSPMLKGIHFISGLPRSGSTLLSALLLQNPSIHAGITSPVGSMVGALLKEMSQENEASIFIDSLQRKRLVRGLFDNYYYAIHPERVVFDTNRGWTGRIDLLAALFPECKVICCIRPIPWIIDSIERLARRNAFEPSRIFGFERASTAYSRAESLMNATGLIGFSLASLKEAMHGAEAKRLLLLPYETLVRFPEATMNAVYEFTGIPPFAHDFENISFTAAGEFDDRLGTPGLHHVQPQVRYEERKTILPPDLWKRFEGASILSDPNIKAGRVLEASKTNAA